MSTRHPGASSYTLILLRREDRAHLEGHDTLREILSRTKDSGRFDIAWNDLLSFDRADAVGRLAIADALRKNAMVSDIYSHGHHESVLRSHTWRTAENSAAYLLPHLKAGQDLLDVGCGPGTITLDLAARVAPGRVVGLDAAAAVIEKARAANDRPEQVSFVVGDVYALDAPDASFDVVHAHQVLQHLSDPVAALREMRRVLRPGGVVAARDSDYSCFSWAPLDPLLTRWNDLYHAIARCNRAEPDAGRFLLGWAQRAGFTSTTASSSTWTYADPDSRAWWGGLWADRVTSSAFASQALEYALADRAELDAIAAAWRSWARQSDGWYAVLHGEILARA